MKDETILNAKVPVDLHTRVRVKAAEKGENISDHLRDLVARDLGFLSFADYVQFTEHSPAQSSEQVA